MLPMRHRFALTVVATLGLLASTAPADQVTLTTGETLTGTVTAQTEAGLVLQHPVLGDLPVPADKIESISIDAPGDGQAQQPEPSESVDADPAAGSDQPATPPADQPEAEPMPESESEPFLADWDWSISAGFSGTEGNSESKAFNFQVRGSQEDDRDRWLFNNQYFYGSSDGDTDENNFSSKLTKDWLNPDSDWFYFAHGAYDYDQFTAWDHRFSVFGGPGYDFIKRDDLALVGRAGLGLTKEIGGNDDLQPEGLLGLDLLRWHFAENQNLIASSYAYPNLGDLGEFRLENSVEWVIDLAEKSGLHLKFGIEHEYESDPGNGAENNDLKYYGALQYDL